MRSFARGEWPHFGADVVWAGSQLPGALQGMLVRLPLEVWPVPEAPFVLLNLLSFGALALLAWYCTRRVPDIPRWFVWGVLLTLPWTLNFSTHAVNTSDILPGSIAFFIDWFEGSPSVRRGVVAPSLAWAMMGAGLQKAWHNAMAFLLANAGRADVLREQRIGRLRSGLVLVGGA